MLRRRIAKMISVAAVHLDEHAVVGYLASFAMTAVATVVAVGVDSGVMIPNLSLIFVVPVIIAGVNFGLGPFLCSALLGAFAYNFY
jgi:K+-sensing histidine kinase KdpD